MTGIGGSAVFSEDERYRYVLTRDLDGLGAMPESNGPVVFVGLNPSTADAYVNDPTITRCVNFALTWRFTEFVMLNLYAYRSTDPRKLNSVDDPVGPDNDRHIAEQCARAGLVVAAWGWMAGEERVRQVLSLVGKPVHALGVTKAGAPRHPLYVRKTASPVPYTLHV